MKKIAIFGSSGFAREVADVCLDIGHTEICFLDQEPTADTYFGFPLRNESEVSALETAGWAFAMGIGDNRTRRAIRQKFPDLVYPNLTHSSATFGWEQRDALEATNGNVFTAGVRLTNSIALGNFGIFNLNCTIGHDCVLGDYINIAPGTTVSGNVQLDEGVYLGTNAAILQGKSIEQRLVVGAWATVGAGSVVTKTVDPETVVVGIPAKPLQKR